MGKISLITCLMLTTMSGSAAMRVDVDEITAGLETKATGPLDGVNELLGFIAEQAATPGVREEEKADAQALIETIFGGLHRAGLVESSKRTEDNSVTVTLRGSGAAGEIATKSKVPYAVVAKKVMTATYTTKHDAAAVGVTGLYFTQPADAKDLFQAALDYVGTAAEGPCKKECTSPPDSAGVVECESCAAYEWYKANKDEIAESSGKMARILDATPLDTSLLSLEIQQGDRMPSRVYDKNRRRIIYSMLAAEPALVKAFIFGHTPSSFGAPAQNADYNGKMKDTYKDDRYMGALIEQDFNGNTDLETFFADNALTAKSMIIGKQSLIGKKGTCYDYPLDMAEKAGQGTSGINFARMVSSVRPELHAQKIYVRPAKPAKVMKMLGLCVEALDDPSKIDSGCGGDDGRILWRPA